MPSDPAAPRHGPKRALRGDSAGVTEVIGYLLVFGILSLVLILSMSAFGVAADAARVHVIELRADSAGSRVAGIVVQTALLAEQQGSSSAVAYRVDLPSQIEGFDYLVRLEPATTVNVAGDCTTGAHPDQVCIVVSATSLKSTAPVFSAGATTTIDLCRIQVGGGPLNVRINAPSDATQAALHPVPAGCTAATPKIFLEATR